MGKETNKKILNAADHNQQNAVDKAKKKGLGPALFPIKKASIRPKPHRQDVNV
tara:strand:+ start:1574 stop:1732 length:159 start_codon:yes stop_codon:yes gene_type:complete